MKCISVVQPWATLIILGAKRYETRSWASQFRGQLAIHASTKFPQRARDLCNEEPFRSALRRGGFMTAADLPRGLIIGTVQLARCLPEPEARLIQLPGYEFGDYLNGRWIWQFDDPQPLTRPLAARGLRGIFEVPGRNALDGGQEDLSSMDSLINQ
jgi:activating signal cointegrator 1